MSSVLQVAPVAVSDAAMLAPEKISKGKGDVKEEGNLRRLSAKEEEPTRKGNMQVIFARPFRETLFHSHALYGFC
jgi:hypothetical protein